MTSIALRYTPSSAIVLARKPAAQPHEPQTIDDIITEQQHQVERFDARLQQWDDPHWQAERKARLQKQRATAQHKVDILHQVAGH